MRLQSLSPLLLKWQSSYVLTSRATTSPSTSFSIFVILSTYLSVSSVCARHPDRQVPALPLFLSSQHVLHLSFLHLCWALWFNSPRTFILYFFPIFLIYIFLAFVLGTLIDQSQHRLSGLKSNSLRLFTSIWLACILSITVPVILIGICSWMPFFSPSQLFLSFWLAFYLACVLSIKFLFIFMLLLIYHFSTRVLLGLNIWCDKVSL